MTKGLVIEPQGLCYDLDYSNYEDLRKVLGGDFESIDFLADRLKHKIYYNPTNYDLGHPQNILCVILQMAHPTHQDLFGPVIVSRQEKFGEDGDINSGFKQGLVKAISHWAADLRCMVR